MDKCFSEVVLLASKAMSFVVKSEIYSKYFAGKDNASPESLASAMTDAQDAFMALAGMGQQGVIMGIMEGIEASYWLLSPENDYEVHEQLMIDTYQKVSEWESPKPELEVMDPVIIEKKAELEKLLSL